MSSIRGAIIENTSSTGTITQIPFFPKYEVELDSHRKVIPYPGKEHIERVLEEYSHQVKDLQRRLNEVSCKLILLLCSWCNLSETWIAQSVMLNDIQLLLQLIIGSSLLCCYHDSRFFFSKWW